MSIPEVGFLCGGCENDDGVYRLGQLILQPPTEIRIRTLTTIAQLLQVKVCLSLCLSLGWGVFCGGSENDDCVCRLGQVILQPPTEIRILTLTTIAQLLQIKMAMALCLSLGWGSFVEGVRE